MSKRKGLFMKCCVVYIFAFLTYFTLRVLDIAEKGFAEPSTLIVSVFGFCSIEGGILGFIKNLKEKGENKNE